MKPFPAKVHNQFLVLALEQSELSPRELAVRFTLKGTNRIACLAARQAIYFAHIIPARNQSTLRFAQARILSLTGALHEAISGHG